MSKISQILLSQKGKEPVLRANSSQADISSVFTWYSSFSDKENSKKYTIDYITKKFKITPNVIEKLNSIPVSEFGATGWIARQLLNGNNIPADLNSRFVERLKKLKELGNKIKEEKYKKPKKSISFSKPSPDEICFNKIRLEIDDLIVLRKFKDFVFKEFISKFHFVKTEPGIQKVLSYYKDYKKQIEDFANSSIKDEQLKEYYTKVKKSDLKEIYNFLKLLVVQIEQYIKFFVPTQKITEAPKIRKEKMKTPLQLTRQIKYKIEDDKYKVKSISPTEIVGASQLWVFNTKTRKLGVFYAKDGEKLSVKGTTLRGFSDKSFCKNLRKPEIILEKIKNEPKSSLSKIMDTINATASSLTGRINEDTVILRGFK